MRRKLFCMTPITDTNFVFKLWLDFVPIRGKMLVPIVGQKDKKIIVSIWCAWEKFCLQKIGVAAGFSIRKWCQILISNTFWKIYLVLSSFNNFFSQGGRSGIELNLVSHTLLALVSCPPSISCIELKKVNLFLARCSRFGLTCLSFQLHSINPES